MSSKIIFKKSRKYLNTMNKIFKKMSKKYTLKVKIIYKKYSKKYQKKWIKISKIIQKLPKKCHHKLIIFIDELIWSKISNEIRNGTINTASKIFQFHNIYYYVYTLNLCN